MELDDRLRNWARWARTSRRLETCGSAEKAYRAPWRQWLKLAEIEHTSPIDVLDAESIEAAWVLIDYKARMLLKYHYVRRMPIMYLCQRLRIKPYQFDARLSRARYLLRERLDKSINSCSNNRKFDCSAKASKRETASTGAVFAFET